MPSTQATAVTSKKPGRVMRSSSATLGKGAGAAAGGVGGLMPTIYAATAGTTLTKRRRDHAARHTHPSIDNTP